MQTMGFAPVGILLLAEHPPVAVLEQLVVRRDVVLLCQHLMLCVGHHIPRDTAEHIGIENNASKCQQPKITSNHQARI